MSPFDARKTRQLHSRKSKGEAVMWILAITAGLAGLWLIYQSRAL